MVLRNELAELREVLARDAHHHLDGPFYGQPVAITAVRLLRLAVTPEFVLVAMFRVYSSLYRHGQRHVAWALWTLTKWVFGCDVAMEATIGPGLRIAHAQDVVVGSAAVIGRDCVLFNGVTLGNRLPGGGNLQPTIGDGALVGAGAKLLGPVRIGDGARIGANAVVLTDVPDGATAVGNPATVRQRARS